MNDIIHICPNCAQEFVGRYCNQCGEKVLEEKDFKLTHIIAQAIGAITNLDSKIFRTLKALFFQPGKLSVEYVRGLRVPYMKPFQIFLIANLFFFIFLSEIDIFRTPSKWFFIEDFDGVAVLEKVREVMNTKAISQAEIAVLYDAKSANLAKGFIFLLLPVIAFITMLLHRQKKIPFGKHLIFGIHYFSFVLIFTVLWTEMVDLIVQGYSNHYYVIPIQLIITLYLIIAFRQFYKDTWLAAVAKGILGIFLIGVAIQLYRMGINIWTLNHI